jgi:hypothetical protein
MDQIHLSPLVDQIQLALGNISNMVSIISTVYDAPQVNLFTSLKKIKCLLSGQPWYYGRVYLRNLQLHVSFRADMDQDEGEQVGLNSCYVQTL